MYDIHDNILSKSGFSAAQLKQAEQAIRDDHGYNDDFFQAVADSEAKTGINALFTLAHADVESAHGTSRYSRERNNLFGFNAIDSDPDQASRYPSQAASVEFYANFLSKYYLTPGAIYYNGTTPHGVFVKYSSSHDSEAQTVVSLMNALQSHITGESVPATQDAPVERAPQPTGDTYAVRSGDTLWALASAWGTTIDAIIAANRVKYPNIGQTVNGVPGYLLSGWVIYLPGKAPVATPVNSEVYITVPAGRNGYLSVIAQNYGTSVQQLIEWNKGKYPNIGTGSDAHIEAGWRIRVI